MDRNGYSDSLLSQEVRCYWCGRTSGKIDRHEIFHGMAYRQKSKRLGCWVNLCSECHRQLHNTKPEMDDELKKEAQNAAMNYYGWSTREFIAEFGKNYL